MGTWNVGIFDNDLASDVANTFRDAFAENPSVAVATQKVFKNYNASLYATHDTIYLALAALQIEHGVIQPFLRKEIIDYIDSGQDLAKWGNKDRAERQKILQDLKDSLITVTLTAE